MLNVQFRTYSKLLNKSFINEKETKSLQHFHEYARALYSGNYEIIEVTYINKP